MVQWNLFVGIAFVVVIGILVLAQTTKQVLTSDRVDAVGADSARIAGDPDGMVSLGQPRFLLANVVLTHGVVGAILVISAWSAAIPPAALGLEAPMLFAVVGGGFVGLALTAVSWGGQRLIERVGFGTDDHLRELLAPDTFRGWVVLLGIVLPLVAGVEELLFRGILIGGLVAGYGFPVWALVVLSSVVFGLGHGIQGVGGIVVTAMLGVFLGVAFVITGNLFLVIVAHYLVNAIEFVFCEGFADGWSRGPSSEAF